MNLNALCFILQSCFEDKGDYSPGDPKGHRCPSVSFTPHLALSVMKNDKRVDKERRISDRGPSRLIKCY